MATVVGSGIMGERLAGGNVALALLGNTLPTGAILVVLILALRPDLRRAFQSGRVAGDEPAQGPSVAGIPPYAGAQIVGGCVGTLVAHGMFDLPLFELAVKARTGPAQWFAEFVATFGLLVTILAVSRFKATRFRSPSASTSRRPIGSPPPRRSPILPSRSPAR